jgi:hypothetical protein
LLFGAILLAIGKRTVTSVLRVMGMEMEQQVHFQTYHRALNRAACPVETWICVEIFAFHEILQACYQSSVCIIL